MRLSCLFAVASLACGPTVVFDDPGAGGSSSNSASSNASSGSGTTNGATSGTGGSGSGQTSAGVGGAGAGTGAGVGTSASVGTTGSGGNSTTGVGGGGPCKTCSEAIEGAPGPLCPSSQPIFDALYQCACVQQCPMECAQACNGGSGDPGCDECLYQHCFAELDTCWQDF